MQDGLERIRATVTSWPGVSASSHRFGGTEFNLGATEIGHIHRNGMVDIPFNRKIRDQLIAEDKAEPHHLLKETGWITFYIRNNDDVQAAIWLFRLSYLFYAGRGRGRETVADALDIPAEVATLNLSQPLQSILDGLTARR